MVRGYHLELHRCLGFLVDKTFAVFCIGKSSFLGFYHYETETL